MLGIRVSPYLAHISSSRYLIPHQSLAAFSPPISLVKISNLIYLGKAEGRTFVTVQEFSDALNELNDDQN